MKKDTKRFFRVKSKEGKNIETISPFCDEAKKNDVKAMRSLMKHLAEYDKNCTVIMFLLPILIRPLIYCKRGKEFTNRENGYHADC